MKDAHDIKGAKGLNVNMAMLYLKKEAYAKALQTIEETIKDSSNTEHMLGYANSIKAMVLHKQGYHKKSLELVEQTIATAKKQKEQEKSLIVRQECFSTILNVEIGNYTKAKNLALNLIDKTKENANLINIYMTLYKVYVHEKDFEKALEFYQLHEKCMKKVDGSKAKNHLASV